MVSIMQGVGAQLPCTWDDVIRYRREHVGSPEQAVRGITYIKNQRNFNNTGKLLPSCPRNRFLRLSFQVFQ